LWFGRTIRERSLSLGATFRGKPSSEGKFGIYATVKGGGISGQAEAIMYGVAKALLSHNPDLRPLLKKAGLLTRDAREKDSELPATRERSC